MDNKFLRSSRIKYLNGEMAIYGSVDGQYSYFEIPKELKTLYSNNDGTVSKKKLKEIEDKISELTNVLPENLVSKDPVKQIELLLQHFRYNPENKEEVQKVKEHFESLKF